MTFEFQNKAAQLNMRVPEPLLDAVKQRAKAQGIPYTRFIRQLMEQGGLTALIRSGNTVLWRQSDDT